MIRSLLESVVLHLFIIAVVLVPVFINHEREKKPETTTITLSASMIETVPAAEPLPEPVLPEPIPPAPVEPVKKPEPIKKEPVKKVIKKPEESKPSPKPVEIPEPAPVQAEAADRQTGSEPYAEAVPTPAPPSKRSPTPAPPPTAEQLMAQYTASHYAYILGEISRNLEYPALARRNGWAGKAEVIFTIKKDGKAENIRIAVSSGYRSLDQEAVRAVSKSSPFPPPPAEAELIIPVTFGLN